MGRDRRKTDEDLTYLFTDLRGSTDLYDRVGDPSAYALVQQVAGGREITLSQDVYDHPGVAELLPDLTVTPETVIMKGVSGELEIYKVRI